MAVVVILIFLLLVLIPLTVLFLISEQNNRHYIEDTSATLIDKQK